MGWKAKLAGTIAVPTFLIGFILLMTVTVGGLSQPIESGTYTGQKIDYSHQRGLIFQTNDLTTKTHERSSQREDWCVPDNRPVLVSKVRSLDEGVKVDIEYYSPLYMWPGTCAEAKVIRSIEVVEE